MCTGVDAKQAAVGVAVVVCRRCIDPVILVQHVEIKSRVHSLPRSSCRKGTSATHHGIQDGECKEVWVIIWGRLHANGNVDEFWEGGGAWVYAWLCPVVLATKGIRTKHFCYPNVGFFNNWAYSSTCPHTVVGVDSEQLQNLWWNSYSHRCLQLNN